MFTSPTVYNSLSHIIFIFITSNQTETKFMSEISHINEQKVSKLYAQPWTKINVIHFGYPPSSEDELSP